MFMQNTASLSREKFPLFLIVFLGILGINGIPTSAQTATQSSIANSKSLPGTTLSPEATLSQGIEDGLTDENDPMAQVTSVSQLTDVRPTDWAFQALQSLVERYGCIVGYPDKTFRGNRAISRYEFAAGLNACMDRINELVGAGTAGLVKQDDLVTLKKIQEEFAAELATLRGRVDALEARTATLEKQQFSTTTKLFGQTVVGLQGRSKNRADFFPVDDGNREFRDDNTNINVITNVQLSLLTQFSPRSLLLTGLSAGSGNTGREVASNNVRLGYEGDSNNSLVISDLTYRQLFGNNLAVIVGPAGVNAVNVFRGTNRVESSGFGPVSRFAQRNPIIGIGNGRGGVGFDWQVNPRISLQGIYSASTPESPTDGIFGGELGETAAGLQLNISPTRTLDLAFNYMNAYSPFGRLGTGVGDDFLTSIGTPLKTNAFGATVSWKISPKLTIGGWGGYTNSSIPGRSGNVETTNWMAFLNFPDLFGKGNLGGIYVGQPPKIVSSDLPLGQNVPGLFRDPFDGGAGDQNGTTTHVEAFYRLRITDNITVTPGVIVLFQPGNARDSDTVTIGALRTTFTF